MYKLFNDFGDVPWIKQKLKKLQKLRNLNKL